MGNLTILVEAAYVPPGLLPVVTPAGSLFDSLSAWDRLAAFGVFAALYAVIYFIFGLPDN